MLHVRVVFGGFEGFKMYFACVITASSHHVSGLRPPAYRIRTTNSLAATCHSSRLRPTTSRPVRQSNNQ